jgi:hypothetical protein
MNPEFRNKIVAFVKKAENLPLGQISSGLEQKAMDLIRSKAKGFRSGGAAIGGAVGATAGGIGNFIDPGNKIDPRTGRVVRNGRLASALTGAVGGGAVGAGLGAGLGHLSREHAVKSYYKHDMAPEMLSRIHSSPQVPLNKLEQIMMNEYKNKNIDFAAHSKDMIDRRTRGEI